MTDDVHPSALTVESLPGPGRKVAGLWWYSPGRLSYQLELDEGESLGRVEQAVRQFRADPQVPVRLPAQLWPAGPHAGERRGRFLLRCEQCHDAVRVRVLHLAQDAAGRWRLVSTADKWLIDNEPAPLVYGARSASASGWVDSRDVVKVAYDWDLIAAGVASGTARATYQLSCPACGGGRLDVRPEKLAPIIDRAVNAGCTSTTLQRLKAGLARQPRGNRGHKE